MTRLFQNLAIASSVAMVAGCSSMGGMSGSSSSQSTKVKQAKLAGDAQAVLQQQRTRPDAKRIPNQLVADARCIAVFPSVVKGGLIVGGQHGKGLVTCRQKSGGFASANPAVYSLSGGSIGLQAGVQKSSVVLLFMTQQSVKALWQPKIQFGSGVSVTAGPKGYDRPITKTSAPVLAYAVSQKGLYAGLDFSGTKMSFSQSANASIYGPSTTPRGVLVGNTQSVGEMASYRQTLQRFAPTASQGSGGNGQQKQQSGGQSQSMGDQQQSGSGQSQSMGGQQQSGSGQSQSMGGQQQSGGGQSQSMGGQQQSGGSQSQSMGGQQQSGGGQSQSMGDQQQSGGSQQQSGGSQSQPSGGQQSGSNKPQSNS